jgi:hypothetical protein
VSDITLADWEALNVRSVLIDKSDDIFDQKSCGASFIPPQSWLEPRSNGDQANVTPPKSRVLHNGRPYPSQEDFYIRSKELQYDNADAFSALTRKPRDGRPTPRLAHFRRFWEGLDNMAYYWDVSADEYILPKQEEVADILTDGEDLLNEGESPLSDEHEPRKRTKWNPVEPVTPSELLFPSSNPVYSSLSVQSRAHPDSSDQLSARCGITSDSNAQKEPLLGKYRGHRIGNGAGMPEQYRLDTVRAFVEPIAWAFGFTLSSHRRQPVVAIKTLHVPIKMSGGVWRAPSARDKARMGWLEGPVLGISCRSETDFEHGPGNALLDVLRELGAALSVAQERERGTRKEVKPGENKWWTTVPRWGGGLGGEAGELSASRPINTDDPVEALEGAEPKASRENRGRPRNRGTGSNRKLSAAEAWKILRPGVGVWDPRVEYSAIGKDTESEYDQVCLRCLELRLILNVQVFLVSSLNHHISVLKLTVHSAYLEYLRTGVFPSTTPEDESWCTPQVLRSPWYDLFKAEDRLEALRALWGVMGYLARTSEGKGMKL